MKKSLLALGGLGLGVVPAVALLTALTLGATTSACITTSAGGALADSAPVPAPARAWVAATKAACPDLPETWIAAVMAQESGFSPDAYADDVNGGTWGLFQLNASIWQAAYGHPWSADLDRNGQWDVRDPDIHATVAGTYLCTRLNGVRQIRAEHPDWASSALPELDALIIAHNAGESRLRTYPALPAITARFITTVNDRVTAWAVDTTSGAAEEPLDPAPAPAPTNAPVPAAPRPPEAVVGTGCLPQLGADSSAVVVPDNSTSDVATGVRTALSYVGVSSGWRQLCDRLACRAYGYATSGYPSAKAHWAQMVATGRARPGDRCPPLGSFVYWNTGRPFGHVSIVVQADPGCDADKILVTANEVFDAATGNQGGVYLLSFARLDAMYLRGTGYIGWSTPVCQGALLPTGTVHPAPSGR
ncbi:transglycosylase SLT domain-containing protein [Cellulomonas fimi]|uniref:Transglycosylase SLT domain-containing protein n=1 Tax=Cellulomonas fimi TaxID=1708 RepID=A0A7Y0LWH3_CELFI|nr:transglycosylase SLT domain-containing protein [Cellulomonas fimi]NMR19194.1 transglycosylase SLT domain-containing protein [Cellulomonas fimi]